MLSRLFSNSFENHKNQRSQIMLDFLLKILQSAKNQTGSYFSPQNSSVIYNYVFLCYLDCFKSFKNHKNQRSQIVLEFHIENITIC